MKESVFRENVIIITGASLGIGQELALQLADQGAWLALAARNGTKLEEVSNRCIQRGGRSICIPTDVSDPAQCLHLIETALAEYGRIDTLVNNAGIGHTARFTKLENLDTYKKVFQVNFWGSIYCTHYALPHLKKSTGRFVFMSSLRGKFQSARADGYCESKHALAGFADSLRMELAGSGVSVTTIYPGWVSTGISSRALRPDGTLTGKISKLEEGAMPVETCARIIIRAMANRKREVVMTLMGKLGLWANLIVPGIVDQVARKMT